MNTNPLSAEERAQFRSIASTSLDVGGLDIGQVIQYRALVATLLQDDTALTIAPRVLSQTPLDSKVKNKIFALFDTCREAAKTVSKTSPQTDVALYVGLGFLVGGGIGFFIAR